MNNKIATTTPAEQKILNANQTIQDANHSSLLIKNTFVTDVGVIKVEKRSSDNIPTTPPETIENIFSEVKNIMGKDRLTGIREAKLLKAEIGWENEPSYIIKKESNNSIKMETELSDIQADIKEEKPIKETNSADENLLMTKLVLPETKRESEEYVNPVEKNKDKNIYRKSSLSKENVRCLDKEINPKDPKESVATEIQPCKKRARSSSLYAKYLFDSSDNDSDDERIGATKSRRRTKSVSEEVDEKSHGGSKITVGVERDLNFKSTDSLKKSCEGLKNYKIPKKKTLQTNQRDNVVDKVANQNRKKSSEVKMECDINCGNSKKIDKDEKKKTADGKFSENVRDTRRKTKTEKAKSPQIGQCDETMKISVEDRNNANEKGKKQGKKKANEVKMECDGDKGVSNKIEKDEKRELGGDEIFDKIKKAEVHDVKRKNKSERIKESQKTVDRVSDSVDDINEVNGHIEYGLESVQNFNRDTINSENPNNCEGKNEIIDQITDNDKRSVVKNKKVKNENNCDEKNYNKHKGEKVKQVRNNENDKLETIKNKQTNDSKLSESRRRTKQKRSIEVEIDRLKDHNHTDSTEETDINKKGINEKKDEHISENDKIDRSASQKRTRSETSKEKLEKERRDSKERCIEESTKHKTEFVLERKGAQKCSVSSNKTKIQERRECIVPSNIGQLSTTDAIRDILKQTLEDQLHSEKENGPVVQEQKNACTTSLEISKPKELPHKAVPMEIEHTEVLHKKTNKKIILISDVRLTPVNSTEFTPQNSFESCQMNVKTHLVDNTQQGQNYTESIDKEKPVSEGVAIHNKLDNNLNNDNSKEEKKETLYTTQDTSNSTDIQKSSPNDSNNQRKRTRTRTNKNSTPEPKELRRSKRNIKNNSATESSQAKDVNEKQQSPSAPAPAPICSFKNILEHNDTLHLTHEGEIPVLNLDENLFNNLPNDVITKNSDKNIMKLLDSMNISNMECDILKEVEEPTKKEESVVAKIVVESSNESLTFENFLGKASSTPLTNKIILVGMECTDVDTCKADSKTFGNIVLFPKEDSECSNTLIIEKTAATSIVDAPIPVGDSIVQVALTIEKHGVSKTNDCTLSSEQMKNDVSATASNNNKDSCLNFDKINSFEGGVVKDVSNASNVSNPNNSENSIKDNSAGAPMINEVKNASFPRRRRCRMVRIA